MVLCLFLSRGYKGIFSICSWFCKQFLAGGGGDGYRRDFNWLRLEMILWDTLLCVGSDLFVFLSYSNVCSVLHPFIRVRVSGSKVWRASSPLPNNA